MKKSKKSKAKPKSPKLKGLQFFIETVKELRHPKRGCPWDLAQTHESLTKYLIEESYEFIEALGNKGIAHPETAEELSDVLLQIGLHARLAEEKKLFNFDKIAKIAAQKIIERHPHVFDPNFEKFDTADEVNKAWESIKARIKLKKGITTRTGQAAPKRSKPIESSLKSVPSSLPALLRSQRLGEKMSSHGFDWPDPQHCFEKINEEIKELSQAQSETEEQEEWGDLVFALCQWARLKGWDSEQVLQKSNMKFINRVSEMETLSQSDGKNFSTLKTLEEREAYWKRAKETPVPIKRRSTSPES